MTGKKSPPLRQRTAKAVSMEEIARRAATSVTTVSLVLNGKGDAYRISAATQDRIRTTARELNYAPNQAARSLRLQRSQAIGLVVSDLSNVFFTRLAKQLELFARSRGYILQISDSGDSEEQEEELIRSFVARSVEGLIIASSHRSNAFLADIARNTPTVFIDRKVDGDHCSWVVSDSRDSTMALVARLAEAMPREIAYIGGAKGLSSNKERRAGFRAAIKAAGMPAPDAKLIVERDYSAEWGELAMRRIHEVLGRNPDALFTASYTLLEGALRALAAGSGELPADIAIATFDDDPLLDFIRPRINSGEQDCPAIAERSFAALERLIGGEDIAIRETVPVTLHFR